MTASPSPTKTPGSGFAGAQPPTCIDALIVAPAAPGLPPLAWWSEINRLNDIQGITLTILGDTRATIAPVAQHLRQRHDIIIWSGHGTANNLILADGETIDGEWLATQRAPAHRERCSSWPVFPPPVTLTWNRWPPRPPAWGSIPSASKPK